jgi:outer membrane protein insertion porin family
MGFANYISPSTDIPIYEKFQVGGAESVRGYSYRQLGPDEGGKVMVVGNIEYKFPIAQENKRTIVQGAFFYDFGGAWKDFNNVNLTFGADSKFTDTFPSVWDDKMKAGYGIGIRFTTPVFPIRLDWGWPVYPTAGTTVPQFYFTLGQIF